MNYYRNDTENNFAIEAEKRGYTVNKSTPSQDMYDHVDFYVEKPGETFTVDVKGRKKTTRRNNSFDDVYTWVEFKNVRGNPGWLYGQADSIVFEREKDYLFIERKPLLNFCLDKVENVYVDTPTKAIYKYYTRKTRKDVISRIKLYDALGSEYFRNRSPMIWEKSL
jgi:hypothetical protein